jgi:hypothetical protein
MPYIKNGRLVMDLIVKKMAESGVKVNGGLELHPLQVLQIPRVSGI